MRRLLHLQQQSRKATISGLQAGPIEQNDSSTAGEEATTRTQSDNITSSSHPVEMGIASTAAIAANNSSSNSAPQQPLAVEVVSNGDGITPSIVIGQQPQHQSQTTSSTEGAEDDVLVVGDIEAPDELSRLGEADTTVAQAWMAKRREQILQGNTTTGSDKTGGIPAQSTTNSTTAVDADTLSRWLNQHNTGYPQSTDYLSTRRVNGQRISPYQQQQQRRNDYNHDAENSSLSSWSIRTDKTPIVSNRVPGAIVRPRPTGLPRLPGPAGGGEGPMSLPLPSLSSMTTTTSTTLDPVVPPDKPTTPPPPPLTTRGQDLSCRDVFDYTKWHGKVLCALILLLVVSIVTVVTTAVFTGSNGTTNDSITAGSQTFVGNSGGNTNPGKDGLYSPTQSPIGPPANIFFAVPTSADNNSVSSLSPTYAAVTLETSPPAAERGTSTVAPTFPTNASSIAPPTTAPILLEPLFTIPTTAAPSAVISGLTAPPSSASSLSLAGLAGNFEETFRFDHGAASLSLSQNGLVMAISDNQFVKIYEMTASSTTSNWQERGTVPASDGTRVVVNADGSVLAVSLPRMDASGGQSFSGLVRVYQYDLTNGYQLLGQELEIGSAFAYYGTGLALSPTGLVIAVGAPFFSTAGQVRIGQARVYRYDPAKSRWMSLGSPLFGNDAQDWFGTTIALVESSLSSSPVGDESLIVAIGAPHSGTNNGYIQTYAYRDVEWTQYGGRFDINNADVFGLAVSSITDSFGSSMSLVQTEGGLRLAVGAPHKEGPNGEENTGMVAVYDYDGLLDQWSLVGAPIVEGFGDKLGSAVTLLNDGNLLVVGSEGYLDNRGAVRFYRFNGSLFVSDVNGSILAGSWAGELYGSSLSATIAKVAPYVSLAVSANKRSDVTLLEQRGRPEYR